MTLKIEVGDKVRIVRVPPDYPPRWGAVGDVGVVKHIYGPSVGIVVDGCGPMDWWHQICDLALFADELEDMPPGTWVTFGSTSCFSITNGTTTRRSCPKKGPQ